MLIRISGELILDSKDEPEVRHSGHGMALSQIS